MGGPRRDGPGEPGRARGRMRRRVRRRLPVRRTVAEPLVIEFGESERTTVVERMITMATNGDSSINLTPVSTSSFTPIRA